jgi:hypothetical protein
MTSFWLLYGGVFSVVFTALPWTEKRPVIRQQSTQYKFHHLTLSKYCSSINQLSLSLRYHSIFYSVLCKVPTYICIPPAFPSHLEDHTLERDGRNHLARYAGVVAETPWLTFPCTCHTGPSFATGTSLTTRIYEMIYLMRIRSI